MSDRAWRDAPIPEIEHFVALPYARELAPNANGVWHGRVGELPGCAAEGETGAAALLELDRVMRAWIADALMQGRPIPEPFVNRKYSGNFTVRVHPDLHRDLVRGADRAGVSLNLFVATLCARSVGWLDPVAVPGPNGVTIVSEKKLSKDGETVVDSYRIEPPEQPKRRGS